MAPQSYHQRRGPDRTYDRLGNKLVGDPHALARIVPTTISSHRSGPWGAGNFTTRFYLPGQGYSRASELKVHFIGEMLGSDDGTKMGALGGTALQPDHVIPFELPPLASTD